MFKKIVLGGAALKAIALANYLLFIRPWHLRWGANDEELRRSMLGDDEIQQPLYATTRVVTINAQPAEIWPWLVQMGYQRGGLYSYEWLDRLFGILDRPSADRIIPEFQHLQVGDIIPLGAGPSWPVKEDKATWLWGLYPQDERYTRLITRLRVHYIWTLPWVLYYLLQNVGDIMMMRKYMLDIKQRAERSDRQVHECIEASTPRQVRQDEPLA